MTDPTVTALRRRVAHASSEPGIYRWLNKEGEVLYVGKAKNLRNRLRSYVQNGAEKGQGPWKQSMLAQLADFDVTIVNSELEALVLETNLIKQLRPKYNVMMKDDKNYVYLHVDLDQSYPLVEMARSRGDKSVRSFGPFLNSYEVRQTLDMLHEIFCFRACKESVSVLNRAGDDVRSVFDSGKLRPCLDYQIGQCCGLCAGVISREDYRHRIAQVMHFFRGDYKPVIDEGKLLMKKAAAEKKFERAGRLRDMIAVIESLQERQLVSDTSGENVDVFGLALLSGKVQVMVMHKREGKLISEEQFALAGRAESLAEVLDQFLPQYFVSAVDIPETVLVGEDFPERPTVQEYLTQRRGKKVHIKIPERGNKSHLLQLAEKNAHEKAKQIEASWEADQRNAENALDELATVLNLPAPPERIEGYDISHTGGTETVGSMVVFTRGKPKNEHYRSFTIHTMASGMVDDYRALKEVLTRRLRHAAGGIRIEEERWNESGVTFGKALKKEQGALTSIVPFRDGDTIDCKEFLVARHESAIIGYVRMRCHPGGVNELAAAWVSEEYEPTHLLPFLIRLMLHGVKKGKVYVHAEASREQQYAFLGFRHVIKSTAKLDTVFTSQEGKIVMVYDAMQHKPDASLSSVPDLLVIDGGKGQLGVVVDVLKDLRLDIPVIGLAKREEEVFVPGKSVPILFAHDSQAKFLLMRLRDEAHRFANRHRSKRVTKHSMQSKLDTIPGIGPDTRVALLKHFGSVDGVRRATDEQLSEILSSEQIGAIRQVL